MQPQSWKLVDTHDNTYVDQITIGPEDVGLDQEFLVSKRTLRGGLRDGVDAVAIDNGRLSITVLPTRGMAVWKARLGELPIAWNSPVPGPVHPKYVPIAEPSGLGWLTGFDELVARCGLESNGAPEFDNAGRVRYPLHGRIGNLPARRVELRVDAEGIQLTGIVEEVRFHFWKLRLTSTLKTAFGRPGFEIIDTVENFAGVECDSQMLYHVNISAPFARSGSRLTLPARRIVPRDADAAPYIGTWTTYDDPRPGRPELCYFIEPLADASGRAAALLESPGGDAGLSLDFDTATLPRFALWKNMVAEQDGYVTGLEPATNFPNCRSFEKEQGRVVTLPPGGTVTYRLGMTVFDQAEQVAQCRERLEQMQATQPAEALESPQLPWCMI